MPDDFVKIARKSEIPQGEVRTFDVQGKRISICNVDESYYAIADLCTHDNAPLGQGELIGSEVECPRHGARFDVKTGKALCLPAVIPVSTYAVEVKGEDVWVSTTANTK
jgi:3-phenylpropionate/trans-cinnamate dioxygenase ferredoxin component